MAELRLAINTQQAESASRDFQRVLNDIKTAARELDSMSLNALGGTLARLTSEAEKFRQVMTGVSTSLNTGLNVNTGNLSAIPSQLSAISTSAETTSRAVASLQNALQQGWRLTPGQFARVFEQERAQVAAVEESFRQREMQAQSSFQAQQQQQYAQTTSVRQQQAQASAAAEENLARSTIQAQAEVLRQTLEVQRSRVQAIQEVSRVEQEAIQKSLQGLQAWSAVQRAATNQTVAIPQYTATGIEADFRSQMNSGRLLPQFTDTGLQAQRQAAEAQQAYESTVTLRMQQREAQARQDEYMAQIRAQAAAKPAAIQTFLPPGTMFSQPQIPASPAFADPTSQGVTGIAISNNKVYETLASSAKQAQQAMTPLGQAFTETKTKKDALDKNLDTMSSNGGSLWRTSFSLRILASAVAFVSFRTLEQEAKQLAETLVDTGQKIERATALFGLMGESSMSATEEIGFATKTAQDLGLAILPSIEGLGKMQAAAYGTAVSGDVANRAFQGLSTALAALGADAQTVSRTTNAFADSIGREEFSGRTIRQLSRELPGFKERISEAFGAKNVQEFIVTLDKGNLTMTQFLLAAEKAFGGGSFLTQGRENVNRLTGAVTGLQNAFFLLQKAMLDAGFRDDVIAGLKDLTAVLTSPAVMDAAKQFGQIFGVVIKDALEIFAYFIDLVARHTAVFAALVGGLITSGVLVGLAASIGLLALAFDGLSASMVPVLLGIGGLAVLGAVGAAILAYATGTDSAQKRTEALAKSTQGLKTTLDTIPKAVPTEHMLNYEKGQQRTREEGIRLTEQTNTARVELDLLFGGVEKNSAAFTGLATAYKFAASEAAKYNILSAEQIQKLAESATAAANYAAEVNKIGENRSMIRGLQEDKGATAALTGLASQGATESILSIERQFQDQFRKMKEHFSDLIYNEQDLGIRDRLVETFKQQANALREASVQAQLYANRLKAIQDLNQGAQDLALERDITAIMSSSLKPGGTSPITESTPSTIDTFRPATVSPASDTINAFQFQLDRANIGAQNQVLNGPVQMSIHGPVEVHGMAMQGAQVGTPSSASALSRAGQYGDFIAGAAAQTGLDPRLIQAVIAAESGGRPGAVSRSGAQGPMQLMPGTANDLGVTNPFDPKQNIEGGSRYLRMMLDRHAGNIVEALSAYNAGPGNVPIGGGVPHIKETQNYVARVLGNMQQLGLTGSQVQSEAGQAPQEVSQAGIGLNSAVTEYIWDWVRDKFTAATQGFQTHKFLFGNDAPAAPILQQISPQPPLELTVDIEKSSAGVESIYDQRMRLKKAQDIADAARQREITRLGAEQQGLRPKALGGESFDVGEVTVARRSRTQLEMERDVAGRRAVGQYNQTVQLTPDDIIQNSQAYQNVQKQRVQAEFQGRAAFDQKTIQDQDRYNISLTSQNNILKETASHLKDDAKYRDIDTQAANMLREAIEKSVSPEILARTKGLIEEWKQLSRAAIDANGPLQKYKDGLLGIKDLNFGVQGVAVEAIQNFGENYLSISKLSDMVSKERERRTTNAQSQAVDAENKRYESAVALANRSPKPIGDEQFQQLRARHEELLATAKDTQASFSPFAQLGFIFKSFADSVLDSLQKMIVQMLILKPLAAELQGALSGQPVQGGFAQVFGSLFGTGAGGASFTTTGATGATLAGSEAIIAGAGLQTGGYVTLQGVEHFERGGNVQYGTDSVPAMLTPGEVVLNKSQQQNLSSGLQSGGNTYVFAPTIHAQDGPSVRKTLPQVQGEFYRATERLAKRNNLSS